MIGDANIRNSGKGQEGVEKDLTKNALSQSDGLKRELLSQQTGARGATESFDAKVAQTVDTNKVTDKSAADAAEHKQGARLSVSNIFGRTESVDRADQSDREKLFSMIDESREHYKSQGPHMDLLLTAMDSRNPAAQAEAKKIMESILRA